MIKVYNIYILALLGSFVKSSGLFRHDNGVSKTLIIFLYIISLPPLLSITFPVVIQWLKYQMLWFTSVGSDNINFNLMRII